jgi:hypothetical protein
MITAIYKLLFGCARVRMHNNYLIDHIDMAAFVIPSPLKSSNSTKSNSKRFLEIMERIILLKAREYTCALPSSASGARFKEVNVIYE